MIFTEVTNFVMRFLFVLTDTTVKAVLLLAGATVIAALSRRASASFRHLVWALALTCVFFLPLLSWNLPHWRVAVTVPAAHTAQVKDDAPPLDQIAPSLPKAADAQTVSAKPKISASFSTASTPAQTITQTSNVLTETNSPSAPLPAPNTLWTSYILWAALVFLAWITGAIILLIRAAWGLAGISNIVRGSFPVKTGLLAEAALAAASQMQIDRSVQVREASATGLVTVPLTFGARHPIVVLPAESEDWPAERLRAALLHEMAHIKRHDWALQMLGNVVGAVYWFNPLVWLALKRMRGESEAACDDLVLAAGVPAQDYARHLLDVALSVRDNRRFRSSAVAMAQGPKVEGRLRAILAQSLSRRPVTQRAAAGFLTVALLVALPLAALRLVAQQAVIPVPAAENLQLKGDFTLVYAVTETNQAPTAILLREYLQLHQDYQRELQKDPYFQPVPDDFYLPFATYQKRRTQPHHLTITISSRGGSLFYQTMDTDYTYARLYDGHQTQTFGDGHSGSAYPGLHIGELTDCPLPAVGLPYVPLLKKTTLAGSSGTNQTWNSDILVVGAEQGQNQPYYSNGVVHAVKDEGTWKLLDTDNSQQQWQFFQHQQFQGLWLASQMRLTKYDIDTPPLPGRFTTLGAFMNWFKTARKPTEVCEYRLLSATLSPPTPATFVRQALVQSAAANSLSQKKWGLYSQGYYVSEALHLRYHLQNWAKSHKAFLQAMSQAPPTDLSAAQAVGRSLQSLPFPLWQGDPGSNHVWDGDPRTGHDGQKPTFVSVPQNAQSDRTAQDFEFARSLNPGSSHVILWASGRVTRNTAQGTKGSETQQEIVPAFFSADGTSNLAEDGPKASLNAFSAPSAPQLKLALQLKPAVGFRRYTSPPLPDGTRYTFLYPSYYAKVHRRGLDSDYQFGTVRIDCIGTRPVPWIAAVGQTPISYYIHGKQGTKWLAPHEEFCSVVVGRLGNALMGRSGNLVFPKGNSFLRQDTRWVGENGSHHAFSVLDKRSQLRFQFIHEDRYIPALFKQTDPIMANSFRILPPGTSVLNLPLPQAEAASVSAALKRSTDGTTAVQAVQNALQTTDHSGHQQAEPRSVQTRFRT